MHAFVTIPPKGRGLPVSPIDPDKLRETIASAPEYWAGFMFFNVRGHGGAELMQKADAIAHMLRQPVAWNIQFQKAAETAPFVAVRLKAKNPKTYLPKLRAFHGRILEIEADGSSVCKHIEGQTP